MAWKSRIASLLGKRQIDSQVEVTDTGLSVGGQWLEFNEQQRKALDLFRSCLEDSRKTGSRHALVLEGGPGTGKTLVCMAMLASVQEGKGKILWEGITRETWSDLLSAEVWKSSIDSWRKVTALPSDLDLIVVDEMHLMSPYDLRALKTRGLRDGFASDLKEPRARGIYKEPLILHILEARPAVLVLVRDEGQRVSSTSMTDEEFEALLDHCVANEHLKRHDIVLKAQHRSSSDWVAFVDDFLALTPICVPRLKANHRSLSPTGEGFGSGQFAAYLSQDCTALMGFVESAASGSEFQDDFRITATHAWPYSITKREGNVEVGEWSAPWNSGAKKGSKDVLKKWSAKGPYTVQEPDEEGPDSRWGVGYFKMVQGFEFEAVGVIIGPDLVLQSIGPCDCGTEGALHDAYEWRLGEIPSKSRAVGTDSVALALNQLRVLLTRGFSACMVLVSPRSGEDGQRCYAASVLRQMLALPPSRSV